MDSVELCDQLDAWMTVEEDMNAQGNSGVFAWPLQANLIELIDGSTPNQNQDFILRVRAWIPSQESDTPSEETHNNDLTNYGYFHYVAPVQASSSQSNVFMETATP